MGLHTCCMLCMHPFIGELPIYTFKNYWGYYCYSFHTHYSWVLQAFYSFTFIMEGLSCFTVHVYHSCINNNPSPLPTPCHILLLAGKMCRANKVFFHTDAAQAVGKIPLNVNEMNIDLMSISGHKIYGPKGM